MDKVMDYETAKRIKESYNSFPLEEIDRRKIIVMGTPRGRVRSTGGGRESADSCPERQVYRVALRLYRVAEGVIAQRFEEWCAVANQREKMDLGVAQLEEFLRQTGTTVEDWGGVDGVEPYLNP
jgi:hypothetical protein